MTEFRGGDSERPKQYFKLFPYLQDELKLTILSFVAYAPFETMPEHYPKSALTDELPLISRRFRSMCNSDVLWKDAVVRITKKEPKMWKAGLRKIIDEALITRESDDTAASHHRDETIAGLVERTHDTLRSHIPDAIDTIGVYKSIFEQVVNQHLRFKGPVFIMPGQVALGQSYALHLFEYRYRLLIAEIMLEQPSSARNGGHIEKPVFFIHANRTPLEHAVPVVLVQVVQCQIYPDGRADVVLLPVHYMWLERLWIRPNSGNLHYAQCLKMGSRVTAQMNHLQRQEALVTTLDRVADQLHEADDDFPNPNDVIDDDSTESTNDDSEQDDIESSDDDSDDSSDDEVSSSSEDE
jgi:hypothetical protein